jgi:type III restriction enzyme
LFQNNKQNIKPVVLIRAPKIEIQRKFYDSFHENLKNLKTTELEKILDIKDESHFFENCKSYLTNNNITLLNFIKLLQSSFSIPKTIILNSKEKEISEEDYKLLNDIENIDNPIRLIFTVNMLNEG